MADTARRSPLLPGALIRNALNDGERLPPDGSDENRSDEAFRQLRTVLLHEEREALSSLRERIDRIETSDLDEADRQRKVSAVLAGAFEAASRTDGERISEALSPVINESIRWQMANSREEMVATLYPLTGRLVSAAVRDAIGKLAEQVNDRIERLLSMQGIKLRLKSAVTGQPLGKLLLADLRKTEIERIYLFERTANRMVFCWPGEDEAPAPQDETVDEILRGVLAFPARVMDDETALTAVNLNDRHLVFRASSRFVVVIEVRGALPESRRIEYGEACLDLIEFVTNLTADAPDAAADAVIDDEALRVFARRLAAKRSSAQQAGRRGPSPALLLAGGLAIVVIALLGWRIYESRAIGARADAIRQQIAGTFPPGQSMAIVEPDRASGTIAVRAIGLVPVDEQALERKIREQAGPYALTYDVAVTDGALSEDIAMLRTTVERMQATDADLRAALSETKASAARGSLAAAFVNDPSLLLERWIARNVIFFSEGISYADPERAAFDLDALADLLRKAPALRLRIIGYSDALGPDATRQRVGIERAGVVMAALERRGIVLDRLTAVARNGEAYRISGYDGTESANRRVAFERTYMTEGLETPNEIVPPR